MAQRPLGPLGESDIINRDYGNRSYDMNWKEEARPLSMTICVVALIFCGIAETFGYPAPKWFIATLTSYSGEWWVERIIRKKKDA